jgi:hypothetical protein
LILLIFLTPFLSSDLESGLGGMLREEIAPDPQPLLVALQVVTLELGSMQHSQFGFALTGY